MKFFFFMKYIIKGSFGNFNLLQVTDLFLYLLKTSEKVSGGMERSGITVKIKQKKNNRAKKLQLQLTQLTFTCSNLTIETLEKYVKYVQSQQ